MPIDMSLPPLPAIDISLHVNGVANARHTSADSNYGSPVEVVLSARRAMGDIVLDPASSEEHNVLVGAQRIYTREDDGFTKPWRARSVFLNPPGGLSDNQQRPVKPKCRVTGACGLPVPHAHEGVESSQKKWWQKLVREWASDRTRQAIFVCFSVELLQTSQSGVDAEYDGLPLEFSICYPRARLAYLKGGVPAAAPPHASCIVYLPPATQTEKAKLRFREEFRQHGHVVVPR
jgi:hypothetical protein